MAEAEDQQNFVAHNGDQVPDQGLDELHNGIPYRVHDETVGHQPYQVLGPQQYEVQDQTLEPQQYEVQDQLVYHQYQLQDHAHEEVQDQLQDDLQYQPQDQEQYHLQDEAHDQARYQVEGEAQDHNGDEVQDKVEDEEEIPEHLESLQKSEPEEGATVGGEEKRWLGWPGETVFRMLVPIQKVGSIIGRKGDAIKKIIEETRAQIKILDGPPGTTERAVMVSGKEEPESSLPPSMDGLLRVHMRIVDGLDGEASQAPPASKVSTRLLVPASQAGSLIGKQGGTVKAIQEASGCIVRVLGSEDVPVFALQDDRVVEVVGEPTSVHKALELIASHLRKFMVDRSIIPFFENQMQKPTRQMNHMPPPHQAWGPPQGHAPRSGQGGYGHNPPPYLQPPPRHDSYYSPPEMRPPTMEKQPHQDISAYGREPPMNVHVSSAPPMVAQIPLSHTDTVIGTSGSNKSYTRLLSGATVTSQETRGLPCEMTVEVSRTGSQVQTAMAEAGALAPAHGSATSTTISLSERYIKNPRLGTDFTTSYKIKGNKKLLLIGRNGFTQEVTTRVEKRHRVVDRISLGLGWKNFVEAENLEIGDTITFGSGGDHVLILLEVEKNQRVWEDHDTQAEAKNQQVWEDHGTQETCSSQSDYIMMLKETCSSQEDAIKSLEKELAEKLKLVDELKNTISAKDEQLCKGELCRKSLLDTIIELRGKVRVFCRVRPGHEEANVIAYPTSTAESPGTDIELIQHGEKHSFTFDKVFDHRATQEEVFTEISELVQSALDGNKVCVFAYGQTGSGKTYTMMGRPGQKGLIPRSLKHLFEASESLGAQGWKYELQVSVLEIYNEKIKDLLLSESESLPAFFSKKINHKKKKRSLLRKLSKRPVRSELTTETVCNIEQIESILEEASQRRSVAKTQMNEYSSRSHFIISLQISGLNLVKSKEEVKGVLNLVDLAGSKSASKNKAEGERLKEAQAINKSLSALGDVMHALATNTPHVPFRNSKLTYLLKPWLEGNSKTLMLVNISPDQSSTVESLSSLKFAARVNSISLR